MGSSDSRTKSENQDKFTNAQNSAYNDSDQNKKWNDYMVKDDRSSHFRLKTQHGNIL
jgi:hypothetical protein